VLDALGAASGLIGQLLAALGLAGLIRSWWRRTLGRRRDHYGRIARLGTGARLSFFSSVLGAPPTLSRPLRRRVHAQRAQAQISEWIYVDRDYYVQALTEQDDETVLAFSVTTRSSRFHPRFDSRGGGTYVRRRWLAPTLARRRWLPRKLRFRLSDFKPLFRIKLGKTRFSELEGPQNARAWLGAQSGSYEEIYDYGRPAYYQRYVFAVNALGASPADLAAINRLTQAENRNRLTGAGLTATPAAGRRRLRSFKQCAAQRGSTPTR
jgi:hypothetical protein